MTPEQIWLIMLTIFLVGIISVFMIDIFIPFNDDELNQLSTDLNVNTQTSTLTLTQPFTEFISNDKQYTALLSVEPSSSSSLFNDTLGKGKLRIDADRVLTDIVDTTLVLSNKVTFSGSELGTVSIEASPTSISYGITLPSTQATEVSFLQNDAEGKLSWGVVETDNIEVDTIVYKGTSAGVTFSAALDTVEYSMTLPNAPPTVGGVLIGSSTSATTWTDSSTGTITSLGVESESLKLSGGTGSMTLNVPSTGGTDQIITLPTAPGAIGTALMNSDGAGLLEWSPMGNIHNGGNEGLITLGSTDNNTEIRSQMGNSIRITGTTTASGRVTFFTSLEAPAVGSGGAWFLGGVTVGKNLVMSRNDGMFLNRSQDESTSTITGANQVYGGMGIGKSLVLGGTLSFEAVSTNKFTLACHDTTDIYGLKFPQSQGTAGQVLVDTLGDGQLEWKGTGLTVALASSNTIDATTTDHTFNCINTGISTVTLPEIGSTNAPVGTVITLYNNAPQTGDGDGWKSMQIASHASDTVNNESANVPVNVSRFQELKITAVALGKWVTGGGYIINGGQRIDTAAELVIGTHATAEPISFICGDAEIVNFGGTRLTSYVGISSYSSTDIIQDTTYNAIDSSTWVRGGLAVSKNIKTNKDFWFTSPNTRPNLEGNGLNIKSVQDAATGSSIAVGRDIRAMVGNSTVSLSNRNGVINSFQVNGRFLPEIEDMVSGAITLLGNTSQYNVTGTNAVTIQLPQITISDALNVDYLSIRAGASFKFYNTDGWASIVFTANASDTINGAATNTPIVPQYGHVTVTAVSDTQWVVSIA
jgi:hypothetical protein